MKKQVKLWAYSALIRAVKTAAQTAVALIGTNALGVTDVDWIATGSAAALAAIVSLLTSVAGLPEVEEGASLPSLVDGAHAKE